jgi:hypothetical protein
MMNVPPHNCSICYQPYNNERSPLILVICGHTFCKECLEMIFIQESREIPCPECKQSTFVPEPKALPKNRSLLDFIIFQEENYRKDKKNLEYSKLNMKASYSGNNQNFSENESDVIFDGKIPRDNFNSPNFFHGHGEHGDKSGINNLDSKTRSLLQSYETILNKLEDTYNKILEEHSYLTEISDVLITKEVDEALDNLIDIINEYRHSLHFKIKSEFEKVNLIKDFKSSLNMYKNKLKVYEDNLINNNSRKEDNIQLESNINSDNQIEKIENEIFSPADENLKTSKEINIKEEKKTESQHNTQQPSYSLTQIELDNLYNEIKFAELYSITLKHYSKEIYNPCKFFYINKFQIEKLNDDLKKLLPKICNFDENVFLYNLENLNSHDEKKIIREISEACNQSNFKKLKFIFSHLRINPNFIYSDVLDQITYQSVGERDLNTGNCN